MEILVFGKQQQQQQQQQEQQQQQQQQQQKHETYDFSWRLSKSEPETSAPKNPSSILYFYLASKLNRLFWSGNFSFQCR